MKGFILSEKKMHSGLGRIDIIKLDTKRFTINIPCGCQSYRPQTSIENQIFLLFLHIKMGVCKWQAKIE